jgi:hypothetical protein
MANNQNNGGTKVENVGMSVHALHLLEQVAQEIDQYGIILGISLIHGIIQKIAKRASELHDAELDRLINKLHLYEDLELCEKKEGVE